MDAVSALHTTEHEQMTSCCAHMFLASCCDCCAGDQVQLRSSTQLPWSYVVGVECFSGWPYPDTCSKQQSEGHKPYL